MDNIHYNQKSEEKEKFSQQLDEYFQNNPFNEGQIVQAEIINVSNEYITVEAGLKSEARIPAKEFAEPGEKSELKVGKNVEVYVEKLENMIGEVVLSRAKVRQEESFRNIEKAFQDKQPVKGFITNRVKGGFIVKLQGANAFLPGSHLDVTPIKDISPLMDKELQFAVIRIDKARGNIIISRRVEIEKSLGINREKFLAEMHEGQIVEGIVKNITDYGVFIDLGGVDGLLHIVDISWKRTKHPSEVFTIADKVKVCITKINSENNRISLGVKQLEPDPWKNIEDKIKVGQIVKGTVTNITGYGAFVEIEHGIEGLIHVTEISWTKKNIQVDKILSLGDKIEANVLEIEKPKRRISLGIKQCEENPWKKFLTDNPVNAKVKGVIKNITEFGLFIGLDNELDGMIHVTDIDWNKNKEKALAEYKKGMEIEAILLSVDIEKERISLGIKQLQEQPINQLFEKTKKGDVITCEIIQVDDKGINVLIGGLIETNIKRNSLSQDRTEQNPQRFAVGEKVDAMVTSVDKKKRKILLSVKALEIQNEKKAMEQYGSADSGASLGDILGEALMVKNRDNEEKQEKQNEKMLEEQKVKQSKDAQEKLNPEKQEKQEKQEKKEEQEKQTEGQ